MQDLIPALKSLHILIFDPKNKWVDYFFPFAIKFRENYEKNALIVHSIFTYLEK